jgi:hypothetical protein
MAAISDATAIIEASDTSGTLHQAAECVRLGRWLFIAKSVVEDSSLSWPAKFLKTKRLWCSKGRKICLSNFKVNQRAGRHITPRSHPDRSAHLVSRMALRWLRSSCNALFIARRTIATEGRVVISETRAALGQSLPNCHICGTSGLPSNSDINPIGRTSQKGQNRKSADLIRSLRRRAQATAGER